MLFGLFGGRATTDDTIERLEIDQSYTRATLDANANMMRQARNRFLDDWDDDYLDQIQKLNAELRETKARLAQVEKERDNLFTTCLNVWVESRAAIIALRQSAESGYLFDIVKRETQRLIRTEEYLAEVRGKLQTCMKTPWRIRKT